MRTLWLRVSALSLLALLCVSQAPLSAAPQAQATASVATRAPEEVGLSSEVLAKIGPTMQRLIDDGRTAGIVTLVARRGRVVHWEANGSRVLGEDPLEPNDIFRIYSMTKPVTSVAVMMLVEEGRLSLDDELAAIIPAFGGVRVWESRESTRPPSRPIAIRDLLSHTSGLTYGVFGNTAVDSIYRRESVLEQDKPLEAWVELVASLPLLADPGARWNYGVSTDVLGRVVEVVSGMPLDRFFEERIFDPLGMDDTGFHVPLEKLDRFAALYARGPDGLRMTDSPMAGPFTRPATFLSGGGGLTSTAADYLRFAQMLLNDGELDGVRLLRAETVRLMRRNHLPDAMIPIGPAWPGQGFGLGFAVSVGDNPGAYWWSGVANTYFWIDPAEELIAFAWTQFMPFGGAAIDRVLRPIVYEAIVQGR